MPKQLDVRPFLRVPVPVRARHLRQRATRIRTVHVSLGFHRRPLRDRLRWHRPRPQFPRAVPAVLWQRHMCSQRRHMRLQRRLCRAQLHACLRQEPRRCSVPRPRRMRRRSVRHRTLPLQRHLRRRDNRLRVHVRLCVLNRRHLQRPGRVPVQHLLHRTRMRMLHGRSQWPDVHGTVLARQWRHEWHHVCLRCGTRRSRL